MSALDTQVLHHGVLLQVDTDDAADLAFLRDLLADLPGPPAAGPAAQRAVRVEVRRLEQAWSVSGPTETLTPRTRPGLAQAVLRALHHAARDGHHAVLLHAGAVAGPRGAVVLAGRSGVGKSTLVASCVRHGALGLTDELLALDDTGQVTGSPAPLNLKTGAAELLPDLEQDGPVRMSRIGRITDEPHQVVAVVGLSAVPDPDRRATSGRDMALLLGQLVIPVAAGTDRGLGPIAALVGGVTTAVVMGRRELATATRFVLDLAGVR